MYLQRATELDRDNAVGAFARAVRGTLALKSKLKRLIHGDAVGGLRIATAI